MHTLPFYQQAFSSYLNDFDLTDEPSSLYEPIQYILNLGGKRIRPVLTLLSTEIFDGNFEEALDAALSIEVFHNFSLVHDDIMDGASLRRSKPTVHKKWDLNTAILSGDAMLIMAYRLFENYELHIFKSLASLFSKTAIEVCEGQQYDIDFESRRDVQIQEYLKMIEYKTAVLLGAAMKMGAIVAKTSLKNQEAIYDFGKNLGIAFQLQDDYLDTFGDPESFGKKIGGDIIENKKTILFLRTLQHASPTDKASLYELYNGNTFDPNKKIESVTALFRKYNADVKVKDDIKSFTDKAYQILNTIEITEDKKNLLLDIGHNLMNRTV